MQTGVDKRFKRYGCGGGSGRGRHSRRGVKSLVVGHVLHVAQQTIVGRIVLKKNQNNECEHGR